MAATQLNSGLICGFWVIHRPIRRNVPMEAPLECEDK